jgi:hypothetical protein
MAEQGEIGSETIGLAAAAVILLLTFGSVVAAGLPIVTAVAGLAVSGTLTGLVAAVIDVPDWSTSLATMMGIGIGIDYVLLMVTRFREWRAAGLDPHAARGEFRAAVRGKRVRVAHRDDDARNACRHDRVGTRRRASGVGAGLERHVHRRAADVPAMVPRRRERRHFRVRPARALVPSFAEDTTVTNDDAAHPRVGRRRVAPAGGELERPRHVAPVVVAERVLHCAARRFLPGASTSASASWKSETSWNARYTDAKRM